MNLLDRIRRALAPHDPTDALYEQGFTGPTKTKRAEPPAKAERRENVPVWWLLLAMGGSVALVCAVGLVATRG